MSSSVLVCHEQITAALECPSGWSVVVYTPPFDISTVSSEAAVEYFGAGFFLAVIPLSAALGAAVLLKFLRG